MKKHQLVGGQDAKSAIPWQVLIAGTVYILGLYRLICTSAHPNPTSLE